MQARVYICVLVCVFFSMCARMCMSGCLSVSAYVRVFVVAVVLVLHLSHALYLGKATAAARAALPIPKSAAIFSCVQTKVWLPVPGVVNRAHRC